MTISRKQFEEWVAEAIGSLPEKFQERMNNVAFFVEDYPSRNQMRKMKPGYILLGLYEGYHQAKRLDVGPVLPDRITIFKKPVEAGTKNEQEVKIKIFETVHHEIAHHFGSGEAGAERAGKRHLGK